MPSFVPVSDLLNFSKKTCIVTGSSRGIGASICKRFADAGANIVVNYSSDKSAAEQIANQVRDFGCKAIVVKADVSSKVQVQKLFHVTLETFDTVDILVNNAGLYPHSSLVNMTEEEWDTVIGVNLKGMALCSQEAGKIMIEKGKGGRIINITSIESFLPLLGHSHYVSSKGAALMFTKSAALEFGPYGITVNAVAPGLINAPELSNRAPDLIERYIQRTPLKRIGEPIEVADACLFLASKMASWITGHTLSVEGGLLSGEAF